MCFRDKHVCEMEGKLWGSGETWYERSQLQMSQLQSVTSACSGGSVLGLCFYLDQFWIVPKMGNRANMELANRNRGHQRWYPGLRRNCCWRSGFAQSHLHILQGCDLSPTGAPKLSIGRYRKAAAMRTSMRSREGRRDQLRVWHQLPPTSLAKWQNMCAKRKENFEEGGETWYERSQLQISQLLTRTLRSTHFEAPHRHRRRLNHLHDRRVQLMHPWKQRPHQNFGDHPAWSKQMWLWSCVITIATPVVLTNCDTTTTWTKKLQCCNVTKPPPELHCISAAYWARHCWLWLVWLLKDKRITGILSPHFQISLTRKNEISAGSDPRVFASRPSNM